MSKSILSTIIISRGIVIRAAVAVLALFGLSLIPGAVGKTFWVAFLLGVLVLIALGAVALIQSRRSQTR